MIGAFEQIGDFTVPGSLLGRQGTTAVATDPTLEWLGDPAYEAQVRAKFARVPAIFNLYFFNATDCAAVIVGDRLTHYGVLDDTEKLNGELRERIAPAPDAITIVYSHNEGTPFLPLTPWILAHRIGHALTVAAPSPFHEAERALCLRLRALALSYGITKCFPPLSASQYRPLLFEDYDCYLPVFKVMGTMRSARKDLIVKALDIPAELLAQYIMTGGVRFNPLPERLPEWPYVALPCSTMPEDARATYDIANGELAAELDQRFAKTLAYLRGKIVVL